MNAATPSFGLFAAARINTDGTFQRLEGEQAYTVDAGEGVAWLHLDRRSELVQRWLYEHSGVDEIDVEALLSEETRPRVYRARQQHGLLVILRGLNQIQEGGEDDLVSIRLWVEKHRIVSFSSRPLAPVQDVLDMLGTDYAPRNAAEVVAALATAMVARMETAIDVLRDRLDVLEETLDDGGRVDANELMRIRRRGANLRRFLGPQKDVFATMAGLHTGVLDIAGEEEWREAANTTFRYIEELDAIRERVAIVNETLGAKVVARANRTVYALTVAAGFFLPLTFVTSLFGMNVGGIPFAKNDLGFTTMLSFFIVWVLVQVLLFRRWRWM